jgi:hypothetical protein
MTSDTTAGFWHEFAATQIDFWMFKKVNAKQQNYEQATNTRITTIMTLCFSADMLCNIADCQRNQH